MAEHVDFTFAGRSIIDSLAAEGVRFRITDIAGDGFIGSDVKTAERPGSDGDRWIDDKIPSRVITVGYTLWVAAGGSHDMLEALGRAERLVNGLVHRGRFPQQLMFSHLDGHFLARVSGATKRVRASRMMRGELEFFCPLPFLYGQERTISPAAGVLSVETNHFVEPVILWTTDATVGAAWIEVDGERLIIDTGISSGQQIRIDCARKETRVGGVLNVENIHGVYPQIRDGSTVETSPGGSLSFTYQERWI